MIPMLIVLCAANATVAQTEGPVGKRPYEMVWVGRDKPAHTPLVDFQSLKGWTVQATDSVASVELSREQQMFGKYVAKLTYRATGSQPQVRIMPPQPIKITEPFDCMSVWIYGNNWGYAPDPTTPAVSVAALFADPEGKEFSVPLGVVNYDYWFLAYERLTPDEIARTKKGGSFLGLLVTNGTNKEDRSIYFDSLQVFTEKLRPLQFQPRPARGIPMFPGESVGTNTGPGKLPFPTRPQTILPANLTDKYHTSLAKDGDAYVFTYQGSDGKLTYRYSPETGTLGDLTAQWEGRGGAFRPCVDGGVYLGTDGHPLAPDKAEPISIERKGDTVVAKWRVSAGESSTEVTYTFRLWAKSLVVDVEAPGGKVTEVRYGHADGLVDPRLVTNPYYIYNHGMNRPAVAVSGPKDRPLFLTGNTDWYLSGASLLRATPRIADGAVTYQGDAVYLPKTNGQRNNVYERLFITVSPRYEEVLPTIPNPQSPYKDVTGTHLWIAYGATNRQHDEEFWAGWHRYGIHKLVVTDHETMWRDKGESFTFRTKTAPGKGGDKGAYDYARFMIDKLGFVYGPYNNYTDFAPVNEYWNPDMVARASDNQLQHAWFRCYAPKPARAVEFCQLLAPQIQAKFHFDTAYCDVHTAVAPWDRTDYDARVPGAGTFAATFYAYGEIMLLQKKAWGGPVYSEGGHHCFYCGLTDGNYGQDGSYNFEVNPWLVDFDLRKMHNLCCNFGMGNPGMFYGDHRPPANTPAQQDALIDRFLAATVAFGHPGFLVLQGGPPTAMRSYYMLQQLASRYCLANPVAIRYVDGDGKMWPTTEAIANGAYKRSQVVTRYDDGTITAVNGNWHDRMVVDAYGRKLDLPPNGYVGWTEDGKIDVESADRQGRRCDYADTPAYIYIDGRGRFQRFPKAASNGPAVCRILDDKYEIIPYGGADCGFAISAKSAVALDKAGKEMGPAKLRVSRGLTYVEPVDGAFSYMLTAGPAPAAVALKCDRENVVAGEHVVVRGATDHVVDVPADAKIGDRLWKQFEGAWIDFTVVPLADESLALSGNDLDATLTSNLGASAQFAVTAAGQKQTVTLAPGKPTVVKFDLGTPTVEDERAITVDISAGQMKESVQAGLKTVLEYQRLASLPPQWQSGMCLRGGKEQSDMSGTGAMAAARATTCGGVTKKGLFMSPPYKTGVGYTFVLYAPMTLPKSAAMLRGEVGKGDGSDPGDGIWFKIAVVDQRGKETVVGEQSVKRHEWLPIEANLAPWAGRTVQIKLISDVGPANNSIGDWAAWADLRIESGKKVLVRSLVTDVAALKREPGPHPVKGLTLDELRGAKEGSIHYDGLGLEGGTGRYGSYAILNGVELGPMTQANGDETKGVWATNVTVPLTTAAIKTLGFHNVFQIRNNGDYFAVRRFWIELVLADGRKCSSDIADVTFSQPPEWQYAQGIGVPAGKNIKVGIWFER